MAKGQLERNAKTGAAEIVLPVLHPGQIKVLEQSRRLNFLCAGRGWWKSSLCVYIAVLGMMDGKNVLWTAPSGAHITNIKIDQFRKCFGPTGWDQCFNSSDDMVEVKEQPKWGTILFRSLHNAANSRGGTPDIIINDEFGENSDGDYADILAPMAGWKNPNCVFWGAGTPNPKNPYNDFYRYLHAENRLGTFAKWIIPALGAEFDKEGELVRVPNPLENPRYTWQMMLEYWDGLRDQPGGRAKFEVEVLCKFISGQGEGIGNIENACRLDYELSDRVPVVRDKDGMLMEFEAFQPGLRRGAELGWYHMGADVAYSPTGDYTVIFVVDRHTMKIVYMRRFRPVVTSSQYSPRDQVNNALSEAWHMFYPAQTYVDITGAGLGADDSMRLNGCGNVEGFHFGGTNAKKAGLISHMQELIEGDKLFVFDVPCVSREMIGYKCTVEGEKVTWGAGTGGGKKKSSRMNDDIPVALALCVHNINPGIIAATEADVADLTRTYIPPVSRFANMPW